MFSFLSCIRSIKYAGTSENDVKDSALYWFWNLQVLGKRTNIENFSKSLLKTYISAKFTVFN